MGKFTICDFTHPSHLRRAAGYWCYHRTFQPRHRPPSIGGVPPDVQQVCFCIFLPPSEHGRCSPQTQRELRKLEEKHDVPIFDTSEQVDAHVAKLYPDCFAVIFTTAASAPFLARALDTHAFFDIPTLTQPQVEDLLRLSRWYKSVCLPPTRVIKQCI